MNSMDMNSMDMASMDMASATMDMVTSSLSSMTQMSATMSAMSRSMSAMSTDMASMMSHMSSMSAMSGHAAPTGMAMGSSGGHSMSGMGGMGGCKISMLWNWHTIDACFISKGWHIKTAGHFAGTCVGLFGWILLLELFKRVSREFDRYIARDWVCAQRARLERAQDHDTKSSQAEDEPRFALRSSQSIFAPFRFLAGHRTSPDTFCPTWWQQLIRAGMYTIEYGNAYLLMLMAMYYNGYIHITMWISALISFFLIDWDLGFAGGHVNGTCC